MSELRYGLDFGTSNSAIGFAQNGRARLLPVDPLAPNPAVTPTVLFVEREGGLHIGTEAIEQFVARNAGREIVRKRVNTGKVIEQFYNESRHIFMAKFDADVNLPGRFFQAIKSFLRDEAFEGTNIFGQFYTLEELIGLFLRKLKSRADAISGQDVTSVVLGRPVHFSDDGSKDAQAVRRLHKAATLAGFADVQFMYEPIGAALEYEGTLAHEELAIVFDFGGGTLDFSVIRLGPGHTRQVERMADVLAVGGVVIGGTTLDEDIMERRLLEYFGSRAVAKTLSGNTVTYPKWLLAQLRSWHTIQLLNERETIRFLKEFRVLARHHRDEVDALICLVQRNYGWELFKEVERAKIELSSLTQTEIYFEREAIRIHEPMSRRSFERLISARLYAIEEGMQATLEAAGVRPEDVGVVLRTGGSSLIPAVQSMLERIFGADKVFKQEVFTSIASGLALAAGA